MYLHHDPYPVFRASKTPAGLYARQKWLDEAASDAWQSDFLSVVSTLTAGQRPDGSWDRSELTTVTRLFGLHLTLREPNAVILSGLDWLQSRMGIPGGSHPSARMALDSSGFKGLPFVPGDQVAFLWGATAFLAAIFGRGRNPDILGLYRKICGQYFNRPGIWSDPSAASNLFRALVVHPEFAHTDIARAVVEQLAGLQTGDGDWKAPVPYYLTLNALAHLDFPSADRQLDRAFDLLVARQNRDGTWGRSDPEWNTFLAVHALRNKGRL